MAKLLERFARMERVVSSEAAKSQLSRWKQASVQDELDWLQLVNESGYSAKSTDLGLSEVPDRDLIRDFRETQRDIDHFEMAHGAPSDHPPHMRRRLEREYGDLWSDLEMIRQELLQRGLLSKVEKGSKARSRLPRAGRRV